MQDKPADQPATQNNSQDQNSQSQKEAGKKSDRMFYVMPNYLTVENEAHVPPISWKEKFAITGERFLRSIRIHDCGHSVRHSPGAK
jgi:hypothetical protein